jgi:hypothetical protein
LPFERVWRNPNAAGGRFLEVVLLPEIRSSSRLVHLWVQVAVEQSDLAIVFTMNVYRFLL